VKLSAVDHENACRKKIADTYHRLLLDTPLLLPQPRPRGSHVYHLYVGRTRERDALRAFLARRGIGTLIHYPVPIHMQPAYQGRIRCGDNLEETEKAAGEILSLPIYPELTEAEMNMITTAIRDFWEKMDD
jgi:dTDP-4-amino-4,6-dideoxygalactose transaminase